MKTFIATLITAAIAVSSVDAKTFANTNIKFYSRHNSCKWHTMRSITVPKGIDVSKFTDKITWKDQGWGNRKGHARIVVKRGNKVVSNVRVFGVAHHHTTSGSYTVPKKMLSQLKSGDVIKLEFYIGCGGGHSLRVFKDKIVAKGKKIKKVVKKPKAHKRQCPKGQTMRNHQYDNKNGSPNCECVKNGDACEKTMGPKGAHCIKDKRCGAKKAHKPKKNKCAKASKKSDMGMGFLASRKHYGGFRCRQAEFRREHMRLSRHRHHMIHRYFAHKHAMHRAHAHVVHMAKLHKAAHHKMVAHIKRAHISAHKRNHAHKVLVHHRNLYRHWSRMVRSVGHHYRRSIHASRAKLAAYKRTSHIASVWRSRYHHAVKVMKVRHNQMKAAILMYNKAVNHRNHVDKHRLHWIKKSHVAHKAYKHAHHVQGVWHAKARHAHKMKMHFRARFIKSHNHWKHAKHVAKVHAAHAHHAKKHHAHTHAKLAHAKKHLKHMVKKYADLRAAAIRAHIAVRKHAMANMHLW